MIAALEMATFIWLAACFGWAVTKMARHEGNPILLLSGLHFLLLGLPLGLDRVVGVPNYAHLAGFQLARQHAATSIVYCAYVSWSAGILVALGRRPIRVARARHHRVHWRRRGITWALVLMALPLVMLALAPQPGLYSDYGIAAQDALRGEALEHHAWISGTALLAIAAGSWIVLVAPRLSPPLVVVLGGLMLSGFWLHGKRSIVFIAAATLMYALWRRGILERQTVLGIAPILLSLLAIFAVSYQSSVRIATPSLLSPGGSYRSARLDFGRDHTVRLALYAELSDRAKILEHRGQSVLLYVGLPVPRSAWAEKPYPYAQYVTSAAHLRSPRQWGWGLTTSWLDEAVANFGYLGLILGPLVPASILRFGASQDSELLHLLSILVASFMYVLHLLAFAPIALAFIVAAVTVRFRARSKALGCLRGR